MAHKYVWSEFREERIEEAGVEVDMGNGLVITVPPPECWPDGTASATVGEAYELILGKDQWAKFVKAGGTAVLLDRIVTDAQLGKAPPAIAKTSRTGGKSPRSRR